MQENPRTTALILYYGALLELMGRRRLQPFFEFNLAQRVDYFERQPRVRGRHRPSIDRLARDSFELLRFLNYEPESSARTVYERALKGLKVIGGERDRVDEIVATCRTTKGLEAHLEDYLTPIRQRIERERDAQEAAREKLTQQFE